MKKPAQIDLTSTSIHTHQPILFPNDLKFVSASPISKRLRYCLRNKTPREQKATCNKFNDTKCFYENHGTPYESLRESNLLRHHDLKQKQSQRDLRARTIQSKPQSIKIINIDCLNTEQYQKTGRQHRPQSKKRSNSLLEGSVLRDSTKDKNKRRRSSSSINPYTQQQYLYFGHKEKETARQILQNIKRKQQELNILKPCQVAQKQLTSRQYCRPLSAETRRRSQSGKAKPKSQLSRSYLKDQFHALQPWEQWVNQDDNL